MINSINNSRSEIENYKGFLNEKDRENIFKRNGITEEFYENYKRQIDQEEILNKLKLKQDAKDTIQDRVNKSNQDLALKRKRKRYSAYVEKDINYTKAKIEKLKLRNLYGDKAEIKRLRERLKVLDKVEREKDSKIVKFTKEMLKRRRDTLKTPESKAKVEEIKKEAFHNLKANGGGALWEGTRAIVIGPLKALGAGLGSLSFSEFFYVLGGELTDHGGKAMGKSFSFLALAGKSTLKGSRIILTGK